MSIETASNAVCEVGNFYLVSCVHTTPEAAAYWADSGGWVPVLGPRHSDAEHLEFGFDHWHIDWRFVAPKPYKWSCAIHGAPHSSVLTNTHGKRDQVQGEPVLRRLKCRREMPDFPVVNQIPLATTAIRWARLEIAQAFTCNKLKPGNICPHRGIDLTPFAKPDGTAICPGHGLRWNLSTGELMPRHAGATS